MVKFSDVEDAFFFVSSESYGLHTVILNKKTGKLYYRSEMSDWDEIDDDLDWENCIKIPHKNDLELGHELVFEFVESHLADDYEQVRQMFRKRGAYGRFKNFLDSKGLLQSWYDFENQQEEKSLREWCKLNEIEIGG
jgi:hypothetical protein